MLWAAQPDTTWMGAAIAPIAPAEVSLRQVLDDGLLKPVFQPVVDLRGGAAVGHEALIRGPRDSTLERPDQLFAAARDQGLLAELDAHCRIAAFRAAAEAGLGRGATLFVNMEPEGVGGTSDELEELALQAPPELQVIVKVTERALTHEPAGLLRQVMRLRRRGFGIAVDDVGADSRSLALMPFIRPDVIKLDLRLVQQRPSVEIAQILGAVSAQAESTGAAVLAEGIETQEHVAIARSLGAGYAQGWFFGRPGPLPVRAPIPEPGLRILGRSPDADGNTPFEVVQTGHPVIRGTKPLLRSISRRLELEALALGEDAVVLATFQHSRYLGPAVRDTYIELGRRLAFAGVLGEGVSPSPGPGMRGGDLPLRDSLRAEWDVSVIGPHFPCRPGGPRPRRHGTRGRAPLRLRRHPQPRPRDRRDPVDDGADLASGLTRQGRSGRGVGFAHATIARESCTASPSSVTSTGTPFWPVSSITSLRPPFMKSGSTRQPWAFCTSGHAPPPGAPSEPRRRDGRRLSTCPSRRRASCRRRLSARRVGLRPGDDLLRLVHDLPVAGHQHRHHALAAHLLDLVAAAEPVEARDA